MSTSVIRTTPLEAQTISEGITARKYGKVVVVTFACPTATYKTSAWNQLCTLPEGFRPSYTEQGSVHNNDASTYADCNVIMLRIYTNGNVMIYIYNGAQNSKIYGQVTFLTP